MLMTMIAYAFLQTRALRALASTKATRPQTGRFPMCCGTELTSNAVLAWCGEVGVEWHYIAPGKQMQNG